MLMQNMFELQTFQNEYLKKSFQITCTLFSSNKHVEHQ
jgi:hypothetical protein